MDRHQLPEILSLLKSKQDKLEDKFDQLDSYVRKHMEEEAAEISDIKVVMARLDERLSGQSANWGMLATIVTSVVVAGCSQLVINLIK